MNTPILSSSGQPEQPGRNEAQVADTARPVAPSPEQRKDPRETPDGRKAVAPFHVYVTYEVRDQNDLRVVERLSGINSAAAIAMCIENAVRGDGLCLVHLQETVNGQCTWCAEGRAPHPYRVIR